jgi:hypothetical protein
MPFQRENSNRKKIDTYYRDSKGHVHYLHSSQMFRTCKECVQSSKQMNYKPYESRIGEPVDPSRIFARFDSLYKRYDNTLRG